MVWNKMETTGKTKRERKEVLVEEEEDNSSSGRNIVFYLSQSRDTTMSKYSITSTSFTFKIFIK